MAVSELHRGDRDAALGHAARAFAYEAAHNLAKGYGIPPGVREPDFIAEGVQLVMALLEEHASALERGENGPLLGMTLSDVIDRVYEYNMFDDLPDERVIGTLLSISEGAWDRSDYPVAINARRRACQLLEKLGDTQRARRAEQLGWLATLVKQSGDDEQALSLYQLALQTGGSSLDSRSRSSLLGRYANLLHQVGDYAVAARVQWQAVLAQRTDISLDAQFPPTIQTLNRAFDPEELEEAAFAHWPLLALNLANCLIPVQELRLAASSVEWSSKIIELMERTGRGALHPSVKAEIVQLYGRIRQRLNDSGTEVDSPPGVFET